MRRIVTLFLLFNVVLGGKTAKQKKFAEPQIIPFVRQNENFPQVVEMLIGSPPQKLKVALCYESYASSNGKVLDQILMFKPKNCGKNTIQFFNASKSKTLKNLNRHTKSNRNFGGGKIFADRIALGSDAALMQNLSFVIADSKDSCNFAGLWPMDPIAKIDVWEPLLKQKPKPVVTITADKTPKIKGVWSTGQLMIGGWNEKSCKPIGLEQYGQLDFYARKFATKNKQISFGIQNYPHGYLDLGVDRLYFGSQLFKQFFNKLIMKNGRYYGDCAGNEKMGLQLPLKSYTTPWDRFLHKKTHDLWIDIAVKKSGGQCELKVAEWKERPKEFKLTAPLLATYCVHQQYEVDMTPQKFAGFQGWTETSLYIDDN
ncbi:hypothetical protein M3Y96_00528200 [Aphelenchoides besseyi]|nr:hypothetical protein M3Y96_00528200 [Aphelenchoides besseyi]